MDIYYVTSRYSRIRGLQIRLSWSTWSVMVRSHYGQKTLENIIECPDMFWSACFTLLWVIPSRRRAVDLRKVSWCLKICLKAWRIQGTFSILIQYVKFRQCNTSYSNLLRDCAMNGSSHCMDMQWATNVQREEECVLHLGQQTMKRYTNLWQEWKTLVMFIKGIGKAEQLCLLLIMEQWLGHWS